MNHSVNAVCRILCETGVQALLLLIVACTASRLLRPSSAAVRCLVWQITAVMMVIMPVLSATLPARNVSIAVIPNRIASIFDKADPVRALPKMSFARDPIEAIGAVNEPVTAPSIRLTDGAETTLEARASPSPTKPASAPNIPDPKTLLVVLWAGIAALLFVKAAIGHLRLRGLKRQCTVVNAASISDLSADICSRLGIRRQITLLHKPHAMPMAWGWLAPVVLLPTEAAEWPLNRLEIVLLHELGHIRRGDWPMQRAGRLLCCLYWFHPLAWICLAGMKRSGEEACDDIVLSSGVEAPEYAAQLLEVIQIMKLNVRVRRGQDPLTVAMAHPAQIHNRLRTILEPARSQAGIKRSTLVAAAAVALCIAPIAGLHVFAQSSPPGTSQSTSSGGTSYKHTEQSETKSSTGTAAKSASQRAAEAHSVAAKLKHQAAVIAQQQHEIAMLRKEAAMAKVQAQSNAVLAARLKRQEALAADMNSQLARQNSNSDSTAAKLQSEALAAKGPALASAAAELQHRTAEIDDLKANLERLEAMYKSGISTSSDVYTAKANIEHLQADLLKRQAELAAKAGAAGAQPAEVQKLKAEVRAAMANLDRIQTQYGAGYVTKSSLDAAQAAAAEAKAELERARVELELLKAEEDAHVKAGQDKQPR